MNGTPVNATLTGKIWVKRKILDENFAASVLPNAVGFGNNAPRYFYPSLPRHFYVKLLLNLGHTYMR